MQTLILIGLAGGAGALCRHGVGVWTKGLLAADNPFPLGTLLVNVAGSLVLGFILGLTHHGRVSPELSRPVGTGFLGAFTTFSTFSCETFKLIEDERHGMALGVVAANLTLGLLAAAAGFALAKTVVKPTLA